MNILVVIDMQNDFITGSLANPAAQEIVQPICDYIKKFLKNQQNAIVCTRDTHRKNYLSTSEGKKLPIKHCLEGTWGHKIHSDIAKTIENYALPKQNIGIVNKDIFCAGNFLTCEISNRFLELREEKFFPYRVEQIEIVGTVTEICVISNALFLKYWYPETEIVVHKNLCAGLSPEAHEAALKVMEACQITIID